jgi:hypothetical protein
MLGRSFDRLGPDRRGGTPVGHHRRDRQAQRTRTDPQRGWATTKVGGPSSRAAAPVEQPRRSSVFQYNHRDVQSSGATVIPTSLKIQTIAWQGRTAGPSVVLDSARPAVEPYRHCRAKTPNVTGNWHNTAPTGGRRQLECSDRRSHDFTGADHGRSLVRRAEERRLVGAGREVDAAVEAGVEEFREELRVAF